MNPSVKDLNDLHIQSYNKAVDEYESRVSVSSAVTKEVLHAWIKHLPQNGLILDVGCAVGYTTEILSNQGFSVDGIEIADKMVDFAKKRNPNAKIIQGDFFEYVFPKKYDGIVAFAFIHLFPKVEAVKAMQKMKNLLKPDGALLITTTLSNIGTEGFENKGDYSEAPLRYRRRWTEQDLEETFSDLGLGFKEKIVITDAFAKTWMVYIVK